ncbi:ATP synthase subunit K [Kiritimatiella glycovorans]|uniref:V-type ATP synthase subunit K n=1 Tax=Kiritimatiella glycovorans TaxID=1307763 RepID=A0A0G3EK48_9BACT|nr:ATP synthase subunit K [Kiritimatiella glycovorans]AKJ64524.1 V-type ATP synthase subunit K [Kiritimatiella glycovorans]
MDLEMAAALGKAGAAAALSMAAIGSALGTGTAGMAAIGAWKKCYLQNRAAPFILLVFIGAPLSQTIYGLILMNGISGMCETALEAGEMMNWPAMLAAGFVGGFAMAMSAWFQGKAGAAGSDALGETGQGFGNILMTLGVVETVALFVMVFVQGAIG